MGIRRRERAEDLVQISAYCVVSGASWYLMRVVAFPIGHSHTARDALIAVTAGVVQGLIAGVAVIRERRRYRDAFVVGGERASDDERAAAVAALRSGQLPIEPRQREAAVSFAWYQLGQATKSWRSGILLGLLIVVLGFTAILSPWLWLLVGLGIVAAPVAIVPPLRWRRRARRLLMIDRETEALRWMAAFAPKRVR